MKNQICNDASSDVVHFNHFHKKSCLNGFVILLQQLSEFPIFRSWIKILPTNEPADVRTDLLPMKTKPWHSDTHISG